MGFFSRAQRPAQNEALESAVGPTSTLAGTLRSDGGVRVDGVFEGIIEVAGNVVVGPDGRITGDITGRNITVGGVVHGNIDGTGQLQILATGQVIGDIAVASVMIDEGGIFQGTSRLRGLDQPALPAPAGPAAAPSAKDRDAEARARTVEVAARVAPPPRSTGEVGPSKPGDAARPGAGAQQGDGPDPASAAQEESAAEPASGGRTVAEPGVEAERDAGTEAEPGVEAERDAGTEAEPGAEAGRDVGGRPDPRASDAAARRFDDGLDIDFGRWDIEPTIPDNTGKDDEPEKPAQPAQRSRSSRRSSRR